MNYTLYHGKSPKEENIIYDNIVSREDLNKKMVEFLKKINFKSYYYRTWSRDGYTYIDYGSYINYFITNMDICTLLEIKKQEG